ncbi:MAG: glycoside hydrolase family 32 protein [Anaerolineae bacterium]|nr:glycoside hydrolase family 32 protein [Anaerolineae bacterium]MCI0610262.1 glycoside hydrolase family 32 protein [Anaerolineae bacterium]
MMRPEYHFTPPQNFLNDPNGLVFYDDEYHQFYQHNPIGDVWGHMSWGHAVSRDLVHWEHLPVALYEEDGMMIFSGSAVVDWHNTSGFGNDNHPPLIAIYTGHSETEQTQNIAYTLDRGRTWIKYEGNPVLSIGAREFRDPKVFWHEPTQRWIMVTALPDQYQVRFDSSSDLKHWTHLSDFGPAGAIDGLWECPDLFQPQIENQTEQIKWVLKVDVLKGTGAQYFIGNFDGTRFINDATDDQILRVDYGNDFYAAQSWSDVPNERRIWIGWLNNWHYANLIPTSPWRGLLSIPRELHLRGYPEGLRLIQKPIEELKELRQSLYHVTDTDIATVNSQLAKLKMDISAEIQVEFTLGRARKFEINICTGDAEETVIGYDAQVQEIFLDRRHSGESAFSDKFAGVHRALLVSAEGKINLHIFVDSCSVEVFANDGLIVISDLIFPTLGNAGLRFYVLGGRVRLRTLKIWRLAGEA